MPLGIVTKCVEQYVQDGRLRRLRQPGVGHGWGQGIPESPLESMT